MKHKNDWALVGPGISIVAVSYGLARYAYGLFLPDFRTTFALSDRILAIAGSLSYAAYIVVTLLGIWFAARIDPRKALIAGSFAVAIGMATIAMANSPLQLFIGVAIAGVSPGLAYTPFPAIIPKMVSPARQHIVYAIINSGTSLGVMLSGPLALGWADNWRISWAIFAVMALAATIWAAIVVPPVAVSANNRTSVTAAFIGPDRVRILIAAFVVGVATSIYWTFSVDLVLSENSMRVGAASFSKFFWTIVGLAGFAGMFAGRIVERLGIRLSLVIFQIGIMSAMLLLSLQTAPVFAVMSGLIFGACFVFMAATFGLWSMKIFGDDTTIGFGLTFLSLSIGQFSGPFLTSFLIDRVGLVTIFQIGAVLAVAALGFVRPIESTVLESEAPQP